MSRMPLHLMDHPEDLVIVRLPAGAVPDWPWQAGPFASMSHSQTETSVLCRADAAPQGPHREGPFRGVEVAGPLAFEMVGVLTEILAPLTEQRISVLAMSTYDTGWVLVPTDRIDDARVAWRRAGLIVTPSSLSDFQPSTVRPT